jgi:hypothetical protein
MAKEIASREDKMANEKRGKGRFCAAVSAGLLAVFAANSYPASAQDTGQQARITAVTTIDLKTAPELPTVPRPADLVINRPTMPMAGYVAAKNAAAAQPDAARQQSAPALPPASGVTLFTQAGSTNESQTTGGNQFPPGGDIATSADWMVQVNNDVVTMFNWNTNAFLQVKLNTFFQQPQEFLFDPRVIHDPYWDKFVVLVNACSNCGNATTNFSDWKLAVSKTNDPTGSWFVENGVYGNIGSGDFADFPQLGMDMNSLVFTFNLFLQNGSFDARVFALAKALVYNGLFATSPMFGGNACTVAPPFVLDTSGVDYLLSFCPGSNHVSIGSLSNSGISTQTFNLLDNAVTVANFGLPPDAQQPGTTYTLDTGDNRFENRSLQVGGRILNVATVVDGHFPAVAWYNFNVGATPHTLQASGFLFAANSSYDWHPSINANTAGALTGRPGEVFATWMSTNPFAGTNVQLRAAGWVGDDGGSALSGIPVFTSAIPLTNQTDSKGVHRSGDYSYIALYPATALGCGADEIGILEGETAGPPAGLWGTHIGIVKHC